MNRPYVLAGASFVFLLAQGPLTPNERLVVDQFLLCIECTAGETLALDSLAAHKRDATRDTLRVALWLGPSPFRRSNMEAQFDTVYSEIQADSSVSLSIPRSAFVGHYLRNFVASYQVRAAIGLARVGTGDSTVRATLDSVQADTAFRRDVRSAARFARDSIWHTLPTGP